MVWRIEDPQGNEAGKVKYDIVRYTRGRGLDLGCGPSKAFPHFIGVDSCKDTALFGTPMRPDVIVPDCSDLSMFADGSMDFVFSSHLLEHIEDYKAALAEWWRVIKVGGHLCLYLPHKAYYPLVGEEGANPDHVHNLDNADILSAMAEVAPSWECVRDEERSGGREYSFLQVYRKTEDGRTAITAFQRPAKTACVVRYGAFGDMLQMANILPELKRQGYHVTVMTTPDGQNILRHDPHVDDWFLQDRDQVPNHELLDFWAVQSKHYDKWINLCESIEGTLLAMPGRPNHTWMPSVRAQYLNKNYLEWTADLAELPYKSEAKFYATEEETARAQALLDELAGDEKAPCHVLWCLTGSSVHKSYPWTDAVVARLMMDNPNVRVIFVGDPSCKILEQGWESEPRVKCLSGEIGIRDTLALANLVDVVVGPETGVLNAVGFQRNVAKVIFLSHSSEENLTKHWQKTIALRAKPDVTVAPCALKPCHQLHYDRTHCPQDEETGAAMCQARLQPVAVYDAIASFARRVKLRRAA